MRCRDFSGGCICLKSYRGTSLIALESTTIGHRTFKIWAVRIFPMSRFSMTDFTISDPLVAAVVSRCDRNVLLLELVWSSKNRRRLRTGLRHAKVREHVAQ